MTRLEHSGVLFISLNPAEHVALTLPGSMLDQIQKANVVTNEQFMFFANTEGSLLRITPQDYEILKKFAPQSPFDEELKRLVSEYFLLSS